MVQQPMSTGLGRLTAALADRYRVERKLGAGGIIASLRWPLQGGWTSWSRL